MIRVFLMTLWALQGSLLKPKQSQLLFVATSAGINSLKITKITSFLLTNVFFKTSRGQC